MSKKKLPSGEVLQTADIRTLVKQGIKGPQALKIAVRQRELEEAARPEPQPKKEKKKK